jgi:hypothetical protein
MTPAELPPALLTRAAAHNLTRDARGWSRPGQRAYLVGTHESGVIGAAPSWVRWWWAPEEEKVGPERFQDEAEALSLALDWLDAGAPGVPS